MRSSPVADEARAAHDMVGVQPERPAKLKKGMVKVGELCERAPECPAALKRTQAGQDCVGDWIDVVRGRGGWRVAAGGLRLEGCG